MSLNEKKENTNTTEENGEDRLKWLPHELLVTVFEYLDVVSLVHVSGTSRYLYSIAVDRMLWRRLYMERWQTYVPNHDSVASWKNLYGARIEAEARLSLLIAVASRVSIVGSKVPRMFTAARDPTLQEEQPGSVAALWKAAWDYGDLALPALAEVSLRSPSLGAAKTARDMLMYMRHPYVSRGISELVPAMYEPLDMTKSGALLPLLEALSLVSWLFHPETEEPPSVTGLISDLHAGLVRRLREAFPDHTDEESWGAVGRPALDVLLQYFHEDCGFGGLTDARAYGSLSLSLLDSVMKLRHGLPISLSIVLSSLGASVGIPIRLIPAPNHFICSYQDPGGGRVLYIDPFRQTTMTVAQYLGQVHLPLLAAAVIQATHLAPVPHLWLVMIRVLNNMMNNLQSDHSSDLVEDLMKIVRREHTAGESIANINSSSCSSDNNNNNNNNSSSSSSDGGGGGSAGSSSCHDKVASSVASGGHRRDLSHVTMLYRGLHHQRGEAIGDGISVGSLVVLSHAQEESIRVGVVLWVTVATANCIVLVHEDRMIKQSVLEVDRAGPDVVPPRWHLLGLYFSHFDETTRRYVPHTPFVND